MTESEFIKSIKELKKVKPREEWVAFTKEQILGQEQRRTIPVLNFRMPVLNFRLAFALSSFVVFLLAGITIVGISRNSVPGEPLHSVKKATEATEESFLAEEQKTEFYLGLAEKRIEELKEIVENQQAQKLSSAIQETTESIKKASNSIPQNAQDPNESAKIVERVTSIRKGIGDLEAALGIIIGENEVKELEQGTASMLEASIKDKTAKIVEAQIEMLENAELDESEQEDLEQAKEIYAQGDYFQALELILKLNNNQ